MIKAVVFDFDGVIIRLSELIKQGAWSFVANHPDIGNRVLVAEAEQFYSRAKGNRYEILARVFKKLGRERAQIPALVLKHANRFDAIVQAGIAALGIAPDDRAMLEWLSERYPLYINSGTAEAGLKKEVAGLGLSGLFREIYGQPHGKKEILELVLKREGVKPEEIVFVGDSDWDYEAAEATGVRFIGMSNFWNDWRVESFPLISSLSELSKVIKTLDS